MNENIIRKLKESAISVYALSHLSGVPYTTVSEIKNCKTAINKCSFQTVSKLAAALGVDPAEITDEILFLDGAETVYNGIRYRWHCDDTSRIEFVYKGERVVVDFGVLYNIPSRIRLYNTLAEWRIQEYIDKHEWEEHANELWVKLNDK